MNFEVFNIDLSLPANTVKDAISVVIHTILFHRAYGEASPLVAECKCIDLSYACCDNEAILRTVEDKIEIFKQKLSKSPNTAELRAQICVVFSDKKQKRNMLGFVKVENVIWEEWVIGVRLLPPRNETDTGEWKRQVESDIRKSVEYVIQICNSKHDHVPRVASTELLPFPFEITFPDEQQSWGADLLRKMIDASPPLLNS